MKECKIVRDLLPSYIDGLTNEVTNQYIEEHLNNCKECKKILENMQKMLTEDLTAKDSKEVKYIKKFNKKMKILKLILLVIVLIFVLSYARKMIIIVNLNNKISEYTTSTNFYIKSITHTENGLATLENYRKDEKYISKVKTIGENVKCSVIDYFNGETINTYGEVESDEDNVYYKTAKLNNSDEFIKPVISNIIDLKQPIMLFGVPLFSTITSEECNGINCYRIVLRSISKNGGAIYYIDKESGLTIRSMGESSSINPDGTQYDTITDLQYKFDIVTDEDFIEPDINEYEIHE